MIEGVPDTENVVYIDEYPELQKRVWLRRLAQQRQVGNVALIADQRNKILVFPTLPDQQ